MDKDIIQGKWKEIKGEILKSWGEMTSDELERFKGNMGALAGELQAKYGYAKAEVERKLNDIIERFRKSDKSDEPDVTS